MMNARDLYQEVILDHNRAPRNFGRLSGATHRSEGHNPLCGDTIEVAVQLDGDVIRDIRFTGSGCAISKASSSLMTAAVKGKTTHEALALFASFREVVQGKRDPDGAQLGKLEVLAGVSEFPMRVKCATLAWHTLKAALAGSQEVVTIEQDAP